MKFLFAVARWGQRNCRVPGAAYFRRASSSFYSLSRDGDSGTCRPGPKPTRLATSDLSCRATEEMGTAEPEALAARVDVSIRCREMGTAEPCHRRGRCRRPSGFYSLSRDGDSGTRGGGWGEGAGERSSRCRRDGDSNRWGGPCRDLAVSIRCREMGTAERFSSRGGRRRRWRFYSLSRDGDSGTRWDGLTAPAWGFYSLSRDGDSGTPQDRAVAGSSTFAVARWGQRNVVTLSVRRATSISFARRGKGTGSARKAVWGGAAVYAREAT